jgi:hypothetical protein
MSQDIRQRRKEDMSPNGVLEVFLDNDNNDIHVTVFGDDGNGTIDSMSSIEFCCVGSGGGQSPHTMNALRELAKAIELDNQESPVRNGNNST